MTVRSSPNRGAQRAPYIALLAVCVLGFALMRFGPDRAPRSAASSAAPRPAAALVPVGEARRPLPAPQPQQAAADAPPALRDKVGAIVTALSAELLSQMWAHPSKAAYDACIAARAECPSLEADVINYAIFRVQAAERIHADELGLYPLIDQHGAAVVSRALTEIVASSKQPLERIAALLIENYQDALAGSGQYAPLPDRAYEDLHLRPIPEAYLIAERHRRSPVAPAVSDEFAALAQSSDRRARRAAFTALGHAQTARPLHSIVVGLSPDSEHWFDAAMAVCMCGMPCAESLLHMAAASPQARTALYEAVAFSPDRDRTAMVALLLQNTPVAAEGVERALREEFLRDALSERR